MRRSITAAAVRVSATASPMIATQQGTGHTCITAHAEARRAHAHLALGQTPLLRQKKPQTATNAYLAGASKTGSEEKWAQAAMEYIYEKNHVNDSRKRQQDIAQEKKLADAFDRLCEVNRHHFDRRLERLLFRMTESLEVMQKMGLEGSLAEALVMNTEQPPGNYRRPSLSPPVPGYEPGFGLDVPQLKSQQNEHPAVVRPTDALQFSPSGIAASGTMAFADPETEDEDGGVSADAFPTNDSADESSYFPYVDAHQIEDLARSCAEELEAIHGEIREAAPLTGVEGEGWEAYVALQRKALARQSLIFALSNDPELHQRYSKDATVRAEEWARRGMLPLRVEEEDEVMGMDRQGGGAALVDDWAARAKPPMTHFAQAPAYQPFRSS